MTKRTKNHFLCEYFCDDNWNGNHQCSWSIARSSIASVGVANFADVRNSWIYRACSLNFLWCIRTWANNKACGCKEEENNWNVKIQSKMKERTIHRKRVSHFLLDMPIIPLDSGKFSSQSQYSKRRAIFSLCGFACYNIQFEWQQPSTFMEM